MNPLTKSGPISPKAHGAWMGAGSGIGAANVIIGLIEAYGTHHALPIAAVSGIDFVVTPLAAFLGAWLQPLMSRVTAISVTTLPKVPPVA